MKKIIIICSIIFLALMQISAQDDNSADMEQANNPLANMTALSFHNYFIPKLTDAPAEAYMNTAWIRFAKPFNNGRFLVRASIPLSTVGVLDSSTGNVNSTNGLGDINVFASYNFISKPKATVGVGPLITAPTASDATLGTGKWQGGLVLVAYIVNSPVFQFGGLVTWQASFAGDENREKTNIAAIQPFYFWQLGKGSYLRGAPIWVFDIQKANYHIPFAFGIGQVVKVKNTLFNVFLETQYSVLHKGTQPQSQIFAGINIQFM